MPDTDLAALVLFAFISAVTPGGANLLVAATGAQFGIRRCVPLILGIAAGLMGLVAAAAVGLGAVVQAAPSLHTALRVAGSAYLLWLSWQIATAGAPDAGRGGAGAPTPPGFGAGLLVPWLNPKGWSMAVGATAAYSSLASSPPQLAAVFATVFGAVVIPTLAAWCLGGVGLARVLRTERQWRLVNGGLGLCLALSVGLMWM